MVIYISSRYYSAITNTCIHSSLELKIYRCKVIILRVFIVVVSGYLSEIYVPARLHTAHKVSETLTNQFSFYNPVVFASLIAGIAVICCYVRLRVK